MKMVKNYHRMSRLIDETIEKLKLDLSDMIVLTEAASGNFIVTPIIALKANAKRIYIICKDSSYGTKKEVLDYLEKVICELNLSMRNVVYIADKAEILEDVNIVTNLGFVRPINAKFIDRLPYDAAIPLMFESWEFREADVDVRACKNRKIPILGTDESVSALSIFKYVGMCALKLLLEMDIEIFKSKILLMSSGGYLEEIQSLLVKCGAQVVVYETRKRDINRELLRNFLHECDAIVVAEQKNNEVLIDENGEHIPIEWLLESKPVIIHIAGLLDYSILDKYEIKKYPDNRVEYGYMTVTTDYVGMRPVIELHTGGLKVGQALVEGIRMFKEYDKAIEYAMQNSPAMDFAIENRYSDSIMNVGNEG